MFFFKFRRGTEEDPLVPGVRIWFAFGFDVMSVVDDVVSSFYPVIAIDSILFVVQLSLLSEVSQIDDNEAILDE